VRAYSSLGEVLVAGRPNFVVLSVPRSVTVSWLEELVTAGVPVLAETPPAEDVEGLGRVHELVASQRGRVQVAEQYQYQPLHAARLALTHDGVIGQVRMVSLSVCHDYHAFSLMRRHLGVCGEPAVLRATTFRSNIESGFDHSGPRRASSTIEEVRTLGLVDFGSRLGVYDFADRQYSSYIRLPRVSLRGTRGEISDHVVRVLPGLDEPVTMELSREETGRDGDLGGYSLRGISLSDRWVYRNPFPGARLSDDEIAVATAMELMGQYVDGGPPFYGVADASQDHYLSLSLHRAASSGEVVRTEPQPWAQALLSAEAIGGPILPTIVKDAGTSNWSL
jgi:hypothetical protein